MQRLWFITNPGSGSATPEKCEALEAVFAERGLALVGRTRFPDEDLPMAATLDAARADTIVLFAGDGTINATLVALETWSGAFLILPGGTMNLLAKALHDSVDPAEIIHAAHTAGRRTTVPAIEAGAHRAFVGVIIGPAASWFRAREAARGRQLRRLWAAARLAWRRTFGRGVRVGGVAGLQRGCQAVFVRPATPRMLVAGIDARDWRGIVGLGWSWLTGEWVAARAVQAGEAAELWNAERRPVLALFDGEPVTLAPGARLRATQSRAQLLATHAEAA